MLTVAARQALLSAVPATHLSLHSAYPGGTGTSELATSRFPLSWQTPSGSLRISDAIGITVPAGLTCAWLGLWNASSGGTFHGCVPLEGEAREYYALPVTDRVVVIGHGYTDGQAVVFWGGTLPTPLTEGVVYYVRDVLADSFRVAATVGGSAINLTADGDGVGFVSRIRVFVANGETVLNIPRLIVSAVNPAPIQALPPLAWTGTPAPAFTAGIAATYDVTAMVSNYSATDIISLAPTSASLPSGVTFDGTQLVASGSHVVGSTSNLRLRATRGVEVADSAAFTLNIAAAIAWASTPSPSFVTGSASTYDLQPFLSGAGAASAAISVVSGALPAGVTIVGRSLSYTGGGAAGNSTVTLRATAVGQTADVVVTVTIVAAVQWSGTPTPAFTVGVANTYALSPFLTGPSSGSAIITVLSGSLPAGVTVTGQSLAYSGGGSAGTSNVTLRATANTVTADRAASIVLVAAAPGGGNTFTAASASQAAVEAAIALASPGDTVRVPAGSGTWNTLALNKGIRLLGAAAWTTGTTTITLGSGNTIAKQTGHVTRLRGFDFSCSGYPSGRAFVVSGSWTNRPVIFEECNITLNSANFLRAVSPGGVMLFKCYATMGNDDSLIQWKDTGNLADWKANSTIGSADTTGERNHYVEGCWFVRGNNQGTDCDDSSRVVFRYNRFDLFCINSHGLDTSENGVRHVECYGNTFRYGSSGLLVNGSGDNMNQWFWWRGGTWVIYNNAIDRLAGTYIGSGKPDVKMDIRSQQDNSGTAYGITSPPAAWISGGQGNYPRQHQIGVGWSSANTGVNQGYVADPCYVWGNTGTATGTGGSITQLWDAGSWGTTTPAHLQAGRDYYNNGTARPGYSTYTYPHPLRESTGTAY